MLVLSTRFGDSLRHSFSSTRRAVRAEETKVCLLHILSAQQRVCGQDKCVLWKNFLQAQTKFVKNDNSSVILEIIEVNEQGDSQEEQQQKSMLVAQTTSTRKMTTTAILLLLLSLAVFPSGTAGRFNEHKRRLHPIFDCDTASSYDASAHTITVPTNLESPQSIQSTLTDVDGDSWVPILLPKSSTDVLYTLHRMDGDVYIPIGRSYDGNDWQSVAGLEVTSLRYCCLPSIASGSLCQVFLPIIQPVVAGDNEYFITSYQEFRNDQALVARFLEKTTFGPTKTEVYDDWTDAVSVEEFARWVKHQTSNVGMTSHREYYRKRLNARNIESYKYGISGPGACDANARWRKFSFTKADYYLSSVEKKFNLEVKAVTIGMDTVYVLSFAGYVRTVLPYQLSYYDSFKTTPWNYPSPLNTVTSLEPGNYPICYVSEILGSVESDLDEMMTFAIDVSSSGSQDCRFVVGGNPPVRIDPTFLGGEDHQPIVLDLSSVEGSITELIPEITKGSDFMITDPISSPQCSSFPNPADNDFRGPDSMHSTGRFPNYVDKTPSKFDQDPPVFGYIPNEDTFAIHDYRVLLQKNTIDDPLMDGGASAVLASRPNQTNDMVSFCANSVMTIFNEHGCKLSSEPIVCSPGGVGVEGENDGGYTTDYTLLNQERTVVCGSVGEVAADPTMDDWFGIENRYLDYLSISERQTQKQTIWLFAALYGKDQLRQRMAWALSQIFVVSTEFIGPSSLTEIWVAYYDIFVRNALGNYRDIIREVSYSNLMGDMLTFKGSKSAHWRWHRYGEIQYPDENYARELFQLFTTGLVKLNMDGTEILDQHGVAVKRFDTKDIVSFGRSWTGFWFSPKRGNYEDLDWPTVSRLDPMTILGVEYRDYFPKRGLDGSFVGDGVPLCVDLPKQPFLKIGAKYRLLGSSKKPLWLEDDSQHDTATVHQHVTLHNATSQLYDMLCAADESAECQYPAVVVLDSNLDCDGIECELDTLRTVEVNGIYYEHLRQPCVQFAFFNDGKTVKSAWNHIFDACANPKMAVAAEFCCGQTNNGVLNTERGSRACMHLGERITYAGNEARCASIGGLTCDSTYHYRPSSSPYWTCFDDYGGSQEQRYNVWYWGDQPCTIQTKVQGNGLMAIVHNPTKNHKVYDEDYYATTAPIVNANETVAYFSVHWQQNSTGDDQFPNLGNGCWDGACAVQDDGTCLCETTANEILVFDQMPNMAQDVHSNCFVGAFHPAIYEYETDPYQHVATSADGEILVYQKASAGSDHYTVDTIFEVTSRYDKNKKVYLKNVFSEVTIGVWPAGEGDEYRIRNPVNFMDIVDPETRDAYYETESVIDQYIYNSNTPPFVAKLLIQHFGISNPSPKYVEAVATAFMTGYYVSSGVEFGKEKWGDLEATIAAIVLNSEATSSVLDFDPANGHIKEPYRKVINLMRSMQYTRRDYARNTNQHIRYGACKKIGQAPYEAPDVFSFFYPSYSTPGQMSLSSLLSPESQVLTLTGTVRLQNGLYSLIRNGLTLAFDGLGRHPYDPFTDYHRTPTTWETIAPEFYKMSVGNLAYTPPDPSSVTVMSELSVLLTAGRLRGKNLELIEQVYANATAADQPSIGLLTALQVIVTTPEFHATNVVNRISDVRETPATPQASNETYKAVVYIHLDGGMDSFYMLAPHTSCGTLRTEYETVRGSAATLTANEMVPINASKHYPDEQPCETFGLNKQLSAIETIYNDGNGLFIANAGHLTKPVSKLNFRAETRTQLFSHHSMELEAQFVDALRQSPGTGVLGRMLDVVSEKTDKFGVKLAPASIGINDNAPILAGSAGTGRRVDVVSSGGIDEFYRREVSSEFDKDEMRDLFKTVNGRTAGTSGLMADVFSEQFIGSVDKTNFLRALVDDVNLEVNSFSGTPDYALGMIMKLMLLQKERGTNRDAFFFKDGGYDTHSGLKHTLNTYRFPNLNRALAHFYNELNHFGLLDSVTVVIGSEFARTLTPNTGAGTDHAWGGNMVVFGGQIKGGFLGSYPKGMTEADETNDGRGRLVPTTSYDAIWNGIANWYGITEEDDLNRVLPNRNNFGCELFTDIDMYKFGVTTIPGCGGDVLVFAQGLILSNPAYLQDEQQANFCSLLTEYVGAWVKEEASNPDAVVRCYVSDQKVVENSDGTYEVTITVKISSDLEGFGPPVADVLTDNSGEIAERAISEGIISDLVNVTETVHRSPAPSTSLMPSSEPSAVPSLVPSQIPSSRPSDMESSVPSQFPSSKPSDMESSVPSQVLASSEPSAAESAVPSQEPSSEPTVVESSVPSRVPSSKPSDTESSVPSQLPSSKPTVVESSVPSQEPSSKPTVVRSAIPSQVPSSKPTVVESSVPSQEPSSKPTVVRSAIPSQEPSSDPTVVESSAPSRVPSSKPSVVRSAIPSQVPSSKPSVVRSAIPSQVESSVPSQVPSSKPSDTESSVPSQLPSSKPTVVESSEPSQEPSSKPTVVRSAIPSQVPSSKPTVVESSVPSQEPSSEPTVVESSVPSQVPSSKPSDTESSVPSQLPSSKPTVVESSVPSQEPSSKPTVVRSAIPSQVPSSEPTVAESSVPSQEPSSKPTVVDSSVPSQKPSPEPSSIPSHTPSVAPSGRPVQGGEVDTVPSTYPSSSPTGTSRGRSSASIDVILEGIDRELNNRSLRDVSELVCSALMTDLVLPPGVSTAFCTISGQSVEEFVPENALRARQLQRQPRVENGALSVSMRVTFYQLSDAYGLHPYDADGWSRFVNDIGGAVGCVEEFWSHDTLISALTVSMNDGIKRMGDNLQWIHLNSFAETEASFCEWLENRRDCKKAKKKNNCKWDRDTEICHDNLRKILKELKQ